MPKRIELPSSLELQKIDRREFLRRSGGLGAFALAGLAGCGGQSNPPGAVAADCRICEITGPNEMTISARRELWLKAMNDPKAAPILEQFEALGAIPPGTAANPESYVVSRPEMLGSVWELNYKYEGNETFHPVVQLRSDSWWGPQGAVVSTLITAVNDPQYQPVGIVINESGQLAFIKAQACGTGGVLVVEDQIGIGFENRPSAVITGPNNAAVGAAVQFKASGSASGGRSIRYNHWNFGDGGLDEGPEVTKSWSAPGSYTVQLKVFDNLGYTGLATKVVSVRHGAQSPVPIGDMP